MLKGGVIIRGYSPQNQSYPLECGTIITQASRMRVLFVEARMQPTSTGIAKLRKIE